MTMLLSKLNPTFSLPRLSLHSKKNRVASFAISACDSLSNTHSQLPSYSWLVEARREIPKNAVIEAELHNPADFAKPIKVTAMELQAQEGESPWYSHAII